MKNKPLDPYDHVEEAGYSDDVKADVRDILGDEEWATLGIRATPKSIAAGATYYVHKMVDDYPEKTQTEIADDFDTTENSVRSAFKQLGVQLGLIDEEDVTPPYW